MAFLVDLRKPVRPRNRMVDEGFFLFRFKIQQMKIGGSRQNMNEYLKDIHEPILQCSHLVLLMKLTPVQKPRTNPVAQCNVGRFFGRLKRGISSPVAITATTFPIILYLPL
ncbi:serpin B10-like [Platysternon megacephalum]|uniref:Serpin B10-like n=1 Tax=Platysternon megacephalum TaxID=55544 RepID=A0A4D9EPR5_9SAUR|nr:serpin B10-like [Platysternon megacephalum]